VSNQLGSFNLLVASFTHKDYLDERTLPRRAYRSLIG
jgi:hypothetical protein